MRQDYSHISEKLLEKYKFKDNKNNITPVFNKLKHQMEAVKGKLEGSNRYIKEELPRKWRKGGKK